MKAKNIGNIAYSGLCLFALTYLFRFPYTDWMDLSTR